jgi:hypothetical protein
MFPMPRFLVKYPLKSYVTMLKLVMRETPETSVRGPTSHVMTLSRLNRRVPQPSAGSKSTQTPNQPSVSPPI